jgi:hypothetical protein
MFTFKNTVISLEGKEDSEAKQVKGGEMIQVSNFPLTRESIIDIFM